MSSPPPDQDNNQRSPSDWTPPRSPLDELVHRLRGMNTTEQRQPREPTPTVRLAPAPQARRAQPGHAFLAQGMPPTPERGGTSTPSLTSASTPASSPPSSPRFRPAGSDTVRGRER